jgi:hypothetical protein
MVIELELNLHLHNKGYKNKPTGKAIGTISNEITSEVTTITPAELAVKVGQEGHTVVLATMDGKRSKINMAQQQVIMLDFDNKDDETKKKTSGMFYTSIQDILADPFIRENASFIYKTLSHTDAWEKFRVVFILDKPLTSLEEVYGAYDYLLNQYQNADKACKDPSRLFFGGTEYIEINMDNTLATEGLPVAVAEAPKQPKLKVVGDSKVEKAIKAKPVVASGEIPTYKLMQQGNKEEVAKRLSVYTSKVESKVQATKVLKAINMQELLGIQFNPFFDLFHFEKNPSAGIFKMEGADVYLYKCHSSSQDNTPMDVIKVTSKLLNTTYMEALSYLIDVCNIKVEMSEQVRVLREQCDLFLDLLVSEELKVTYPAINERFWRYKTDIYTILNIFKENIYEDENGALRSLTWLSVRTLAQKVYGTDTKKDKVSRLLNLLTYTNWIDKLDESQIPAPLLKKLKETQNANKREKRSNVFELLTLGDDFFNQLNMQCEEMKESGFTMKGFSQEYVVRTHGQEVADAVFVQDKGKKPSKSAEAMVKHIHQVTMTAIETDGYIAVNDILAKVQKKYKSKGYTETKYKQALSEMLDMYGLQKTRLTKDLKERFEITNLPKNASPTILIKAV